MIGTLTTTTGVISLRSPPPISTRLTLTITNSIKPSVELDRTVSRRPNSLYEVLRVERTATPTEIKTAYRSLAKIYHPDASDYKQHGNSNGDRDFIEIYNAYETLKDPVTRASYDLRWNGGVRLGLYTVVGRRQGFYTCRRWETDQCW